MRPIKTVSIILISLFIMVSIVPFVKGATQVITAGETWSFVLEDAKEGDVIIYEYSISDPDHDDKLLFWIEGPDGTRYATKTNENSAKGELTVPEDGIWKILLKNNNWFDSILITYKFEVRSSSPVSEACCGSFIFGGILLIIFTLAMIAVVKRRYV